MTGDWWWLGTVTGLGRERGEVVALSQDPDKAGGSRYENEENGVV